MLSLKGILQYLNEGEQKRSKLLERHCGVYYHMSLHIDGACPAFTDLRHNVPVYPHNYFGLDYQYIFDTYLLNRHPRENETTRQWRLSVYKPFTQAPFQQVIQVLTGAIFQDSGYSVIVNDKDDNDYIWGENFHGRNLIGYLQDKFQDICNDPNGVFIIIPKEPAKETTTKRIEPDIWFINSRFIKWHSDHEIIFERDEIVWAINQFGYFRFQKEEDGKYKNIDDNDWYYGHLLGYKPIVVAGGLWNTQGFYDSWLTSARAVADEFVSAKSAEQLVNKEASHPWIIEAGEDCADCEGTGKIQVCNKCARVECECEERDFEVVICNRCKGKGEMSHNPADRMVVPYDRMDRKLIDVVSPPVDVNKFHFDNNKAIFEALLQALHLNHIEEAQSGVAKDKDMETRYQFILRVSNDLFDRVIPAFLKTILSLRNVRVVNGNPAPAAGDYTIVKPTQFQIKTSADLLAEYDAATKSLIPDFQRAALLEDYTDKQFGGNDVLKRKTVIINQMDKLAVSSPGDIQITVMNGAADLRDWQLHLQLPLILDELVREKGNEWFLGAEFGVVKDAALAIFEKNKPSVPKLQPDVIDDNKV